MSLRRRPLLFSLASLPFWGWAAAPLPRIHFLIPVAPGSGTDNTARVLGDALKQENLISAASFENLSGGGGGRAMAKLIEIADRAANADNTLMVSSTTMVVRALQGVFPHTYRDITPIAALFADYGVFAVRADSPIRTFTDWLELLRANSRSTPLGGGSVRGSLDHIVAAMTLDAAGIDARKVTYLPFDGGGEAAAALLSGEATVISTGLGESIDLVRAGRIRLLAVTSKERLQPAMEVPTLTELGLPIQFANWRGVFGPPGLSPERQAEHFARLQKLVVTKRWQEASARFGWVSLYREGPNFLTFLQQQEKQLSAIMHKLGMLR